MKLNGKTISAPQPLTVVIPRGNDDDLVFVVQAVLDYSEFDKICVPPSPPIVTKKGGEQYRDINDVKYLERLRCHANRRFAWMILESLKTTPNLEWETVNFDDPDTWENYEKELETSGLTQTEINEIMRGILEVNAMDADKFKQARDRFTRSQAEKA